MRLELKEFAKAARSMHQQHGGIKRTRLMLHLRPYKTRKTFLLKVTDGRTTLTSRVEHQGQIKMVGALVADFVAECTRLSTSETGKTPPVAAPTSAANTTPTTSTAASAVAQNRSGTAGGGGKSGQPNTSSSGTAVASVAQASSQPHNNPQPPPSQQPQQKNNKQANKGKKGKKH